MAELPRSPLPPDPAYWEELARRIGADAAGPLAAYSGADSAWYGVLARRAPWLIAASAAAMLILWLVLPGREPAPGARWLERALEPDEIAGTLVSGPEPPSVEVLMVQFPPASAGEGRQ